MLTIQFVPYFEIEDLSSIGRIRKLLKMARENKIVLLEGRLKREEETELIKATMEDIDDEFKGIEIAVIFPEKKDTDFFKSIRHSVMNALLGNRQGFTIIGSASLVKEIKKDPNKIQLITKEPRKKKKKGKK